MMLNNCPVPGTFSSPKCQSSCASLGPRALSRSSIAHCGEFPAEQRRHVVAQDFVVSVRKQLGPRYHRSEEHTSELQSLMRISYAVFCLKKTTEVTCSHMPD